MKTNLDKIIQYSGVGILLMLLVGFLLKIRFIIAMAEFSVFFLLILLTGTLIWAKVKKSKEEDSSKENKQ
jgi:putative Mn2+ efflux pump MntP